MKQSERCVLKALNVSIISSSGLSCVLILVVGLFFWLFMVSEEREENKEEKKLIKSWWKCMQFSSSSSPRVAMLSDRTRRTIIKTFILAHVTCSKLNLNCTNPSYRLSRLLGSLSFLHFLHFQIAMTGPTTDYYSVLFPFACFSDEFAVVVFLSYSALAFSSSFFISFHHYFIFPQLSAPESRSFLFFWVLISPRHWRLRSLRVFFFLLLSRFAQSFIVKTCWAPIRWFSRMLLMKKSRRKGTAKVWQRLVN